jgi:hypothetical protein
MKIAFSYKEIEYPITIHAECTGRNIDYINARSVPHYDFVSQLNPFVLHGDNLCIVLSQYGRSSENLIGLQNYSKHCIKYEWHAIRITDFSCEIKIEPTSGFLKAGFTKLFRVTVDSLGCGLNMELIPVKCDIYRYNDELFREYLLPDGYFEYTDKGFYEKV